MIAQDISKRYRSSYRVSRWINALGELVQLVGLLTGLGLFFLVDKVAWQTEVRVELSAILGSTLKVPKGTADGYLAVAVILLCVLVFFIFWLLGTIISAVGQTLRAVLDTAVNTSPILSYDEKLRALK
jgi:hypothetical protein